MDLVAERLYIGSSADALHRVDQLRARGITAVLNVARDLVNTTLTSGEFKVYHIGLMDGGGNHEALCEAAVLTLTALLEQGETVLIHCHEGKSRSAVVSCTYLWSVAGLYYSIDNAEEELRKFRPRINIHPELKASFKALYELAP